MSKIKRFVALLCAMALVLSLAACRTKDEVALSFSDGENSFDMTAALYMCLLIDSDLEFKNSVYDTLSDEEKAQEVDYLSKTYEDKDYTTWVTEKTLEAARKYAYIELLFEKLGLTLTADDLSIIDSYSDSYWTQNGYSESYMPNGVAYSTYKDFFANSNGSEYSKINKIFDYYYGESDGSDGDQGSLRPSEEEITKGLSDNFIIADTIRVDFTDSTTNTTLTDDEKAEQLAKLQGYADELNAGATFQSIYVKHNGEDRADNTAATEGDPVAKDKYASVFGSEATGDSSGFYDDIKKMKVGEVKVLESTDAYLLAVKQDIMADPYYLQTGADTVVNLLKADEFEEDLQEQADEKLTVTRNEDALGFYTPNKISYPTQAATATATTAAA